MARYVIALALFAIFAVAMAQNAVPKEAAESPKDLQTAPAIGLGFYGHHLGLHHHGLLHHGLLHHGLLHHGLLHHGLLHRGIGFYG